MKLVYIPPIMIFVMACAVFIGQRRTWQQQPATKRFVQQNIPLNEIFEEWDRKKLQGPRYICTCTQARCNSEQSWPFRSFEQGETVPVLGATNKNLSNDAGFTKCSPINNKK